MEQLERSVGNLSYYQSKPKGDFVCLLLLEDHKRSPPPFSLTEKTDYYAVCLFILWTIHTLGHTKPKTQICAKIIKK